MTGRALERHFVPDEDLPGAHLHLQRDGKGAPGRHGEPAASPSGVDPVILLDPDLSHVLHGEVIEDHRPDDIVRPGRRRTRDIRMDRRVGQTVNGRNPRRRGPEGSIAVASIAEAEPHTPSARADDVDASPRQRERIEPGHVVVDLKDPLDVVVVATHGRVAHPHVAGKERPCRPARHVDSDDGARECLVELAFQDRRVQENVGRDEVRRVENGKGLEEYDSGAPREAPRRFPRQRGTELDVLAFGSTRSSWALVDLAVLSLVVPGGAVQSFIPLGMSALSD